MTTPLKKIVELATITPGFSPKPKERKKSGQYLLLGGRNIRDGKFITTAADSYVDEIDRESFRRAIAKPGDAIVSMLFDRRKLYLYDNDDPPAVVNNSCAIIRAGQQSDYIVSYLRSMQGASDFLEKARKATGGAFIPRVSTKDLGAIEIPILPLEKLARLGDARIERASTKQLLELQQELESKNVEIERLRASHEDVVRFYEDRLQAVREQLTTDSLVTRIKHGETANLEFKSSLRYNLHLRNLLMDRIVPSVAEFVEFSMVRIQGKTICHVTCKQSKRQEMWLKPDKNGPEFFYVRIGPSSTELQPRQAFAYIREHFEQK